MLNVGRLRSKSVAEAGPAHADVHGSTLLDADLVAHAKRDRRAFAVLYDRYLDAVYRYCYSRLGSREAAEDATSQVFTKALAALPRCRDDAFRSWLFAIAHNVIADCHGATRPSDPLESAGEIADPTPTPDELALRDDDGRTLRKLLTHLPPDQRNVVELRLAGLTGPEIARTLGRTHGAIRIAQFRAYARLRSLLTDDQPASTNQEVQHAQ